MASPIEQMFTLMSVGSLILCIAFAIVLGLPALRYSRARQGVALLAQFLTMLLVVMIPMTREPEPDFVVITIVCVPFAFGFGLSAVRGPNRAICWVAYLLNSFPMYGFGLIIAFGLMIFATELAPSQKFDESMGFILAGVPVVVWLALSKVLVDRLRSKSILVIRAGLGQCPTCAYDLRGTPQGSACPECGAAIDWRAIRFPGGEPV